MDFDTLSLGALLACFGAAALVVGGVGFRLTVQADRLADVTGMGEAIAGVVLLGMATSLSGVVVSVSAAMEGQPSLAFPNAVGGIAAQTAFIALADLVYRRANLEHAAADASNLYQAAFLTLLLGIPVAAYAGPEIAVAGAHPATLALPVMYVVGVRIGSRVRSAPMWKPVATAQTRVDAPDEQAQSAAVFPLALEFAALAAVLGLAGWVISLTGAQISLRLGVSATAVGALMTAVATSLRWMCSRPPPRFTNWRSSCGRCGFHRRTLWRARPAPSRSRV
ncbi:hypothetical protein [Rubrimonas cliftonensis]|nr:hypothetical protein [Rubrimonas cliftonensis]